MEINNLTIRTLSMLGQRGAFGTTLYEIAKDNNDIIALTADLCNTSGLDRFKESYPNRFINTGIAEQNLIGIAAGLAEGGNIPYATTFSNFIALRACEQIRHFLGYMKENVKLVGLASGFAMGLFGITHYGIEDIAALRSINNLTILSPSDCLEVYKCTLAASQTNCPTYIRLSGIMNNPIVHKNDYDFEIGKAEIIQDGNDIAILATGSMVNNAIKAAQIINNESAVGGGRKLSIKIVNIHTIKPIDIEAIKNCTKAKLIVTVEEHSIIGGLGSTVAECLCKIRNKPPQLFIGIEDIYKKAGTYEYLLEEYGLSPQAIAKKIIYEYKNL